MVVPKGGPHALGKLLHIMTTAHPIHVRKVPNGLDHLLRGGGVKACGGLIQQEHLLGSHQDLPCKPVRRGLQQESLTAESVETK